MKAMFAQHVRNTLIEWILIKGILAVIISKILLLQERWLKIIQLLVWRNERTKYVFMFQNTPEKVNQASFEPGWKSSL